MPEKFIPPEFNNLQKGFWIKPNFFEQIKSGEKTIEVRIIRQKSSGVKAGDVVTFKTTTKRKPELIRCRVNAVRIHKGFTEVVNKENITKILPKIPISNSEKYRAIAANTYPNDDIDELSFEIWDIALINV